MKKFEYKIEIVEYPEFRGKPSYKKVLNDLGEDGWELVRIILSNDPTFLIPGSKYLHLFLKREKIK